MQDAAAAARNPDADDPCNLFVAGVPPSCDEDALWRMFAPFGVVAGTTIIRERGSGASRGFGFVRMATVEQAAAAILSLHGAPQPGGRRLTVQVGNWNTSELFMSYRVWA